MTFVSGFNDEFLHEFQIDNDIDGEVLAETRSNPVKITTKIKTESHCANTLPLFSLNQRGNINNQASVDNWHQNPGQDISRIDVVQRQRIIF